MALRCLILEDQVMFAQLLSTVLRPIRELEIAGLARTCREGIQLCRQLQPDLLILDLALPDGDGTLVARAAIQANPRCRVLVLSAEVGSFVCPADLEPHFSDVIDKATTYDSVTAALAELLRDGCSAASQHGRPSAATTCNPLLLLTPRQREVFLLLGRGLQNKEIARELGLEVNTVESHRKEIARRLTMSGAELLHLAALQVSTQPGLNTGQSG
jgi:DNA-binding NarL/FixJ family response regulator